MLETGPSFLTKVFVFGQGYSCLGNRALTIIIYLLTLGAKYVGVSSHARVRVRGNTIGKSNQFHKITII